MPKFDVLVMVQRPGNRRAVFLGWFDSVAEAEAYIAGQMLTDKEGVERGDYSIDAPELKVNPRR